MRITIKAEYMGIHNMHRGIKAGAKVKDCFGCDNHTMN